MNKSGLFITGTDTGIGKTGVSSLLVSALRSFDLQPGYFKPIQTGSDLDTLTVSHLSGIPAFEWPKPVYQLSLPAAPYQAAQAENTQIELDRIVKVWKGLDHRNWVVEGAGGLLVPLNAKQTIRDLIQVLHLKLLIVSSTRLGTINHTLLTIEAAKKSNIEIVGIVLIGDENVGLTSILTEFSGGVPVLARIPFFENLSPSLVADQCTHYFSTSTLRMIYGDK